MADPYTRYYMRQAEGKDSNEIYRPYTQKGDGIGSFLGGLFRRVFPLFTSGAKVIGQEALSTGVNLLKDLLNGKSMKESVTSRVTEAGSSLTKKAANKMGSMVGSGYKTRKRKLKTQSRGVTKRRKVLKRVAKKKKPKRKSKRTSRKKTSKAFRDIFS